MYADPRSLDTPPPISRFRRPWSPLADPDEPRPLVHDAPDYVPNANGDYWDPQPAEHPQYQRRRREPSDVSVEALDLADYARTLHARQGTTDRYPPFPFHESNTPSSPPHRLASPDSFPPLSLVSRGATRSSQSHAHSSTSRTSRASHRPFSLPPPPVRPILHPDHSLNRPRGPHSPPLSEAEPEIDVSQFPAWSRRWYDSNNTKNPSPYMEDCPPFLRPHLDNPHRHSPFDRDYPTYSNALSSSGHSFPSHTLPLSTPDLAPWTSGSPDHPSRLDPEIKEERIRMLQREFGTKGGAHSTNGAEEERIIGSVDAKGKLITEGPKKRVATRVLQLSLALAAAVPSIYAAVVCLP